MKIVTKHKDYYDWVVRETDPRKVFVRGPVIIDGVEAFKTIYGSTPNHDQAHLGFLNHHVVSVDVKKDHKMVKYPFSRTISLTLGSLWFCDKRYDYVYNSESKEYYYRTEHIPENILEALEEGDEKRGHNRGWGYYRGKYSHNILYWLDPEKKIELFKTHQDSRWLRENKVNTTLGYAIVYMSPELVVTDKGDFSYPAIGNGLLSIMQFYKVMSPTETYTELYNWIPYVEPDLPGSPDDMYRYEEKGFDKKTSFRKDKK